jgi:hypothetical protein
LTRFRGHCSPWEKEGVSTMPKTRPPYTPEFRRRLIELVRKGRTPEEVGRPMPKPSPFPPEPRKGPQKAALTPEQIARKVTDKRPSPVGQPTKVELTIKIVLPRELAERLTARAIREGRNIEAVIQEILEGAAEE